MSEIQLVHPSKAFLGFGLVFLIVGLLMFSLSFYFSESTDETQTTVAQSQVNYTWQASQQTGLNLCEGVAEHTATETIQKTNLRLNCLDVIYFNQMNKIKTAVDPKYKGRRYKAICANKKEFIVKDTVTWSASRGCEAPIHFYALDEDLVFYYIGAK